MPEKITNPIDFEVLNTHTFEQLIVKIKEELEKRLCQEPTWMVSQTIAQSIQVTDAIVALLFSNEMLAVIEATIVNELPVIKFMSPEEVVLSTSLREKIFGDELLSKFAIVKRSEEEIQKAQVKMAALAKLTPEEIAALGLSI